MTVYSYEDIAGKVQCDGWYRALCRFEPEEVPEDIRSYWFMAQQHKNTMEQFVGLIKEKIDDAEAE